MANINHLAELQILSTLKATGAFLDGVKVKLFTAPQVITDATLLTDLTAPTFAGYADSAVLTWGTPYINDNQQAVVDAQKLQFTATGITTPETVYGYAVVLPGVAPNPDTLKWLELFTLEQHMTEVGDAVSFVPQFVLPQSWDQMSVVVG
jgi:hypothetical protein